MTWLRPSCVLAALGILAWSGTTSAQDHSRGKDPDRDAMFRFNPDGTHRLFSGPGEMIVWGGEGTIGVSVSPVDDVLRSHLGLPERQGAVVRAVRPGSPGAKAGLKVGDILLSVGDAPVKAVEDVDRLFRSGGRDEVELRILREGKPTTVKVTPERPKQTFWYETRNAQEGGSEYWIGVSVNPVDDTLRSQLKLPEDQGLVITSVVPDSSAARAGLKANDILLKMAGEPLRDAGELIKRIDANGEKPIALDLIRAGRPLTAEVTPLKRTEGRTFKFTHPQAQNQFEVLRHVYPGITLDQHPGVWDEWQWQNHPGNAAPVSKMEKQIEELLKEMKAMHKELDELREQVKRNP